MESLANKKEPYKLDLTGTQCLLRYNDIYGDEAPDIEKEIVNLNMHKTISIISELISIRNALIATDFNMEIPFELVLKKEFCGVCIESPEQMFSNPVLRKDMHIISLQMLLLLLKKVIQYGNHDTLSEVNYEITKEDYAKVIQLQLVIADKVSAKEERYLDLNHFIYSTYHLNYSRNVANEFLRMYYMLEILSKNKEKFDKDVQEEYKNYYQDFTDKYGLTPIQFVSVLFFELNFYKKCYPGLTYSSLWCDIDKKYSDIKNKNFVRKAIEILAVKPENLREWCKNSEFLEWDFSQFYVQPFLLDNSGNYISISDVTLDNIFFEKLYWLIRECYPKEDEHAMDFFGRLFEYYIQNLTAAAAQNSYQYIHEFSFGKSTNRSSDAYLRNENNLLVIEAKKRSVLQKCMTHNESMALNKERLFLEPILQADKFLSKTINQIDEFKDITEAYIISVTTDNINAVPEYHNQLIKEVNEKKQCDKTKYFFNFNIEEYELLMYLCEQNENVFDILKNYYRLEYLKPFQNYILDLYPQVGMTEFMNYYYNEAVKEMKNILFEK